jgi:hypothetical protein
VYNHLEDKKIPMMKGITISPCGGVGIVSLLKKVNEACLISCSGVVMYVT